MVASEAEWAQKGPNGDYSAEPSECTPADGRAVNSPGFNGLGTVITSYSIHYTKLYDPVIERVLRAVYPDQEQKRVVIRSFAMEGIIGHMATRRIHSLEAGLILIADGCDMEKGRARIPLVLNTVV